MIYKRESNTKVTSFIINRVSALFEELKWEIIDSNGLEENTFRRFCEMLGFLSTTEQDLLCVLTKDFLRCSTFKKYHELFSRALRNIDFNLFADISEIIAIPLVNPEEAERAKSGSFALYLFKKELGNMAAARGIKFNHWIIPDALEKRHSRRVNALIILLDDFLGSGETATKAIEYYSNCLKVSSDRLLVIALIAQTDAIAVMESFRINYAIGDIRYKGISDSKRIEDKQKALELMDRIESKIKVRPKYRRGFHMSEALVCMERCPNNTFPVYWCRSGKNGTPWPAPFER